MKNNLKAKVKMYKQEKSDELFESIWYDVKDFAFKQSLKYFNLTNDEKTTIAQECLWKCLDSIEEDKNLLTYFGKCFSNTLINTYVSETRNVRVANNEALSIDRLVEDSHYEPQSMLDNFDITFFVYQCQLTEIEAKMCKMIHAGYTDKETMSVLGLSIHHFKMTREALRDKVSKNYLLNK